MEEGYEGLYTMGQRAESLGQEDNPALQQQGEEQRYDVRGLQELEQRGDALLHAIALMRQLPHPIHIDEPKLAEEANLIKERVDVVRSVQEDPLLLALVGSHHHGDGFSRLGNWMLLDGLDEGDAGLLVPPPVDQLGQDLGEELRARAASTSVQWRHLVIIEASSGYAHEGEHAEALGQSCGGLEHSSAKSPTDKECTVSSSMNVF